MKRGVDIFLEHAFGLRRDCRAHQVERIDRKKWIPGVGLDVEAFDETLGFQRLKFGLVLDAGQCFGRRFVVGRLENSA